MSETLTMDQQMANEFRELSRRFSVGGRIAAVAGLMRAMTPEEAIVLAGEMAIGPLQGLNFPSNLEAQVAIREVADTLDGLALRA